MAVPTSLLEMPPTCRSGDDESWTCAVVYNWTDNEELAHAAEWLIGRPLAIVWLVVLGLLARWILFKVINRLVARAESGVLPSKLGSTLSAVGATNTARRAQRARTMGSLLKSIVTGVILAVVLIMAVSELGYNIAPLIASAGILGVALGFGAQSLVKDLLSGIFMIFEDQYGVGDVITFSDIGGVVESVGLRVTRMRDVEGTVWYVRNGEILRVGNQSQNWARSVLDISVSYQEDIDKVRRVLTEIAHEMWEDEAYRPLILEEPEVWGVESLGVDAILVRVALKTVPLEQWGVSREMRARIKARFDAEGIEIPFPQRVVWHRDGAGDADRPTESGLSGQD